MEFEWNSTKAAANLQKHKIDFQDAIAVFDDAAHLEVDSSKPEHGEVRKKAIGMMDEGLLITVIFTDRGPY